MSLSKLKHRSGLLLWMVERRVNLLQMMLVVVSYFVELFLKRPQTRLAVHKLERRAPLVMHSGIVNDAVTRRIVDAPRERQWSGGIVKTPRPGILVERPHNLSPLAEHAPNPIEQHGFGIGEMVQDEPH